MVDQHNTTVFPQWTIPSFQVTAGRFPLDLEAVSLNVLSNILAPGLPVLSRHPRYWSIYTYLIKRFQDTRQYTSKTDNRALGRYLKVREIAFACAALLHHEQEQLRSVIGSDTIGPWLTKNKKLSTPLPVSIQGELGQYIKQPLGGYGQVYRGAMLDLELIWDSELNPKAKFDIVYGEVGNAVADTFAAAISGTRYVQEYIDKDDIDIPLDVIKELGEASCFCLLHNYPTERKLLTDVLLGNAQSAASTHAQDETTVKKRVQRAETVRLFLDLASRTQESPIDEVIFRELLYFGHISNGVKWQPRQANQKIWRQWWLTQLREFIVSSLNGLFFDFITWGQKKGGVYHPQSIDQYIADVGEEFLSSLPEMSHMKLAHVSLGQLAQALDKYIIPGAWPLSQEFQNEADRIVSENTLSSSNPVTILLRLLLVQRRLIHIQQHDQFSREEQTLLEEGGKERLSTQFLLQWLARCIEHDEKALQTFTTLIKEMIVTQHIHVALAKLPYNTFRFYEDEEDDGILFASGDRVDRSSISIRFDAISEALYGLNLIQSRLSKPFHTPTNYGSEIING